MLSNLKAIHCIEEVPFAAVMFESGECPVLFNFLVPGIDVVIWKMRPSTREPLSMELRSAAIQALEEVINGRRPGAAIRECEGYSIFAFQSVYRADVMQAMELCEVVTWSPRNERT